jgi:predicted amidohydrolase
MSKSGRKKKMEMKKPITLAAAQLGPDNGNKRETIQRIVELIKEAGDRRVDILGFPEAALTPFFPGEVHLEDRDRFFDELPSTETQPIFAAARDHGVSLVLAYGEKEGIHRYNTAIVTDSDGAVLGKYRKIHIPLVVFPTPGQANYEKIYFEPGNLGLPVFQTKKAPIGVQICYDRRFPEGYRVLALKGAKIIVNPTCMATYNEKERSASWELLLQARALENQVFVIGPNKVGQEGLRTNIGRSFIASPIGGEIIAQASSEGDELVIAKVDLEDVERVRAKLPLGRDRRTDLYGELLTL